MTEHDPDALSGAADDPLVVRLAGPTPAGGDHALLTYLDDDGEQVPRSRATRVRIEEFSAEGVVLASTVGTI